MPINNEMKDNKLTEEEVQKAIKYLGQLDNIKEECTHEHFSHICNSCGADLLLEAEARRRTEAVEDHITELKQCPQCFTMKSFSTAVCFRCLDRKEAMREAKAELRKKIEGMNRSEFVMDDETRHQTIAYNTALSDIITLLEEGK